MPLNDFSLKSVLAKLWNSHKGFFLGAVSFEFIQEDSVVGFVENICKVKAYNIQFIIIIRGLTYNLFNVAEKLCHTIPFLPKAMFIPTVEPVLLEVIGLFLRRLQNFEPRDFEPRHFSHLRLLVTALHMTPNGVGFT